MAETLTGTDHYVCPRSIVPHARAAMTLCGETIWIPPDPPVGRSMCVTCDTADDCPLGTPCTCR